MTEFEKMVMRMRTAQKNYFRTRDKKYLQASKQAEKAVDDYLLSAADETPKVLVFVADKIVGGDSGMSVGNSRFKFRVWDKLNQKYFNREYEVNSDDVLISDHPLLGHDGCLWETEDFIIGCARKLNINNYIIEQCTGLKDQCGKLIYEGDVVEYYNPMADDHYTGVVTFDDNETTASGYYIKGRDKAEGHEHYLDGSYCRVIGNCHEWRKKKEN